MTFLKPTKPETEYFTKQEVEALKRLAEKKRNELKEAELNSLKKLHAGRCASCGFQMTAMVFKGVTIEKCFNCGGVFLDNGELEKLSGEESHFLSHIVELFKF